MEPPTTSTFTMICIRLVQAMHSSLGNFRRGSVVLQLDGKSALASVAIDSFLTKH